MKRLQLLFGTLLLTTLTVSCYVHDDYPDNIVDVPAISLGELIMSYDLWYVDINKTTGNGEVPFLQRAFTITFDHGVMLANNNLVGLGETGKGFGIAVGDYHTYGEVLEIDHDIDGYWTLEVEQLGNNLIRLYHRPSHTSYYLEGYQRSTFNYTQVFYDNIHYFLQEYQGWEKTYTSIEGAINDFDDENYLRFLTGGDDVFWSSVDGAGTPVSEVIWDYEGVYTVYDVAGDDSLKTLTLDYDFLGNDYFELYVIDDETIELYHPDSGTVYEFTGRGYVEFLKTGKGEKIDKKRRKVTNPVMNTTRKRRLVS